MYRLQICTILQREMTEGASSAAQTSMKKTGGWITWWNFVPATWEQPQRGLSDLLFASIAWCKQIRRYGMLQQNNLRGLQLCQSDTRLDQKCPICRKQHQKQMTKSKELYEKSRGKWSSCNVPNWDVCLSGEETYKRSAKKTLSLPFVHIRLPLMQRKFHRGGSRRMDEEDESWLVALSILNLKNLLSAI